MPTVIEALLVTKGHIFEREPFFEMIDTLSRPGPDIYINWTHVEQPAAEALMDVKRAERYDVIVWYDMPGVIFTGSNPPFAHYDPSPEYKEGFLSLLDAGKPMLFLHHAIAAWPTWPEFAELLGGRFHFLPGELGGKKYPGSGYRFRVPQVITVENPNHPIVAGLAPQFDLNDEAYMYAVLEDEVNPLLSSDFSFTADKFHHGGIGFQDHPRGSNLIGWTKLARNAPIAYLQIGHGPKVYSDQNFLRLIANSVLWAKSDNPTI
ncbi:ThuA domain-containing protein [Leisingera sp. SS27]|uniref:ThuA domain-containing protein n=1 Tax=Leisingera sp. SS27 TaxID=2979462 RepID=UPI00232BF8FA|nr:ThuA domain-containing protein [Leisingera sp. SS27]MDC0660560.1 ThuA domain-containing protein [Leisingera sp. SS27]